MKRVVVTGMGVVSSIGHGLETFEKSLREGKSGVKKWSVLEDIGCVCQLCAVPEEITLETKEKYFNELTIRNLSHHGIIYGSIAGMDAWTDAGLEVNKDEPDWDSGTIFGIGASVNDDLSGWCNDKVKEKKIRKLGGRIIEQMMNSGPSAYVGGLLGLGNQVTSNSAACATGTEAFVMSYERIASGKAKRMVAGGCESFSPLCWAGFDAMRILCRDSNNNPEGGSRPLSPNPSGFVPGAGGGALVLEELDSALERGARIYAEILGGNINSGGQRQKGTMTRANPNGMTRCIHDTISDAAIEPQDIDLIAGHLTSTMGDVLEVQSWSQELQGGSPYINSLKSMIGHCLGASGTIELTAAILQMNKGFVHASLNSDLLHPEIESLVQREKIPLKCVERELNIVAKSSFGFGDVNSCVILKNWKTD